MIDFWDAAEQCESGEYMKEADFDRKVSVLANRIVKKHDIKFDPEQIIPADDDLADRVWQAGVELFLELGVYCKDTGRIIKFSEKQLKWALNHAATSVTYGQGPDLRTMTHRKVEDSKPPFCANTPVGCSVAEERFVAMVQSYAQEPLSDTFSSAFSLTVHGRPIKSGTPQEIEAGIWNVIKLREAAHAAGRPLIGIHNLVSNAEQADGTIAAVQSEFGAHPNDGDAGVGTMQNYYFTGQPEFLEDSLALAYYWADIAVDHRDFTVHQWVGGWPWKTCAYSKFRDGLYGYLETGDPYLLDTVLNAAESYWQWYRSNWPRCTIGRDNFEVGAWALLWRLLDTEHARERCLEFVRMNKAVLEQRGVIGGQMGGGPHPGYLSSLYMTGVTMVSLGEVGEACVEKLPADEAAGRVEEIAGLLDTLSAHYLRDDVELFPSNFGPDQGRKAWGKQRGSVWSVLGLRAYGLMARLRPEMNESTAEGLRRAATQWEAPLEELASHGRIGNHLIHPIYFDALLLGATWTGQGVDLEPVGDPSLWPAEQTVRTPRGDLHVQTDVRDGEVAMQFTAELEFPVEVRWRGAVVETTSKSKCTLGGVATAT